jgi:glycolate oxidase FAD binding subunit
VLEAALAEHGQRVALPQGGTVGGALAVGRSGIRRLGEGAMRDAVLQVSYVSDAGEVVKAGGPTVKNVSGFDLCRLLVGSYGTLGFLGEVILRTRPVPELERWFTTADDPWDLLAGLYRPASMLWDGTTCWVLLEGHPDDVDAQARAFGLAEAAGPPPLPATGRWSLPPSELPSLRSSTAPFVAEIGVGIVHHSEPVSPGAVDSPTRLLHQRLKDAFDPHGRLNPGVSVLCG